MTEEKLNFKQILPLVIIVFIDMLGLTIIIPLLPLYAASFGATPFQVGLLAAAYPLMQFIGSPLLGGLSDRFGRRPILLISQTGTFIGFLILGGANGLIWLFVSRLIDGISGGNISTAQAALTDSTSERNRTQALGLIGAAFGIGFVIGPVIAFSALAISGNNYHVPAFIAAGFSLVSIVLTYRWLEETLPPEKRKLEHPTAIYNVFGRIIRAVRHPKVGVLFVLLFAYQLAFSGFEHFLSLFTLTRIGLNASGNALIFVFVGVILIAIQGHYIGPWSRKLGDRRLIYMGLGLLTLGFVLTATTPRLPVPWYDKAELQEELKRDDDHDGTSAEEVQLPDDENHSWFGIGWLLIAMVPMSIGASVLQPSINSMITKGVDATETGAFLGVSSALLSSANAIAPVVSGALFQSISSTAPFWAGAALVAILFILARRLIQ
ncbi:MAG: MFS transporter [Anaerolineales bacterium]|nr:MFS transporter [Anaerolineales bacterium]